MGRNGKGGIYGAALLLSFAALVAAVEVRSRRYRRRIPMHFRYSDRYRERITLRDGTRVRLRLIRPADRWRLAKEMQRLSEVSRYQRFHSAKARLTDAELHYLTRIDGVDHLAIGAMDTRRDGLGVARFVRFSDAPDRADAAVVVADRARGKGLGKALLTRLIAAARERGIATLRCEVLATNTPALALFEGIVPGTAKRYAGQTVIVEVPTGADT